MAARRNTYGRVADAGERELRGGRTNLLSNCISFYHQAYRVAVELSRQNFLALGHIW
jgi:hypothetical protein